MFTKFIWILLCFIDFIDLIDSAMEPFVVGGHFASIYRFPHSAFLSVSCANKNEEMHYWICGGSIINQDIVLTAAHCLAGCSPRSYIAVTVGHEDRQKGLVSSTHSYIIHEYYNPDFTSNDIALLRLKTKLSFSSKVRRVVLMKNPPYNEMATVAGWGLIDEELQRTSNLLKYIEQVVWPYKKCRARIRSIPSGTLCATSKRKADYASRGDSGSALVVRDYIQIGLVSFKMPVIAKNLIVYTDVGHYYEWIQETAKMIYCT